MKNLSAIAALLFTVSLAGLCGCATESGSRRPAAFVAPNLRFEDLGIIGIISSSTYPEISFETPLSRHEAGQHIVDNRINYEYPGPLSPDPISGMIFISWAVAHGVGSAVCEAHAAATGIKGEPLVAAHVALNKVECASPLQNGLRAELVRQLQQTFPGQIQLVAKPLPADADEQFVRCPSVRQATLAWLPKGETAQQYLTRQGIDTVLEIELKYPALAGDSSLNPIQQLNVDGQVRLWRVRDGVELARLPFSYAGKKARFLEWGKDDARQLRAEVQACCRKLAADVSRELVTQIGVAVPDFTEVASAPHP